MNKASFENQYPEIASLLGRGFWSKVDPHHPINFAVVMDNRRGLDYYSRLIDQTPAEEIATSYENDLYTRRGFDSFLSELVGYIATDRWLCSDPDVLDLKGTKNLPEFACDDVDVEVARIRESREIDRVRVHLMQELGGGCTAILEKKPGYDNYASDGISWAENERQVEELISKIEKISRNDLPTKVETNTLKLQVREADVDSVAYMGRSSFGEIVPDGNDQIVRDVKQKAKKKCRERRPLIVFIDLDIQTVDMVEEVIWKTIGQPHGFAFRDDVEISEQVKNTDPVWEDYLTEIGAIPGGSGNPNSAIPPGDEGIFASDEVSCVAGVMVRFDSGDVTYVPNVYTDKVDSRGVFDRLGWETETRPLKGSDI